LEVFRKAGRMVGGIDIDIIEEEKHMETYLKMGMIISLFHPESCVKTMGQIFKPVSAIRI